MTFINFYKYIVTFAYFLSVFASQIRMYVATQTDTIILVQLDAEVL